MESIRSQAPKDWAGQNMEFVISTEIIDGRSSPPKVEATYFWQLPLNEKPFAVPLLLDCVENRDWGAHAFLDDDGHCAANRYYSTGAIHY